MNKATTNTTPAATTASANFKFFKTKKAAMAYKVTTGFPFSDQGKDAPSGERWAIEILTQRKPRVGTKAAIARNIVEKMAGKERKDVLPVIMAETGLSPRAASTYYYNARSTLGLVNQAS